MRLIQILASAAVAAATLPFGVQALSAAEPDLNAGIICFAVTERGNEEIGVYTSLIDNEVMNKKKPVEATILTREGGDPATVRNRAIAQLQLQSGRRFTGKTETGGIPNVPIEFELSSSLSTINVNFLGLSFSGECR